MHRVPRLAAGIAAVAAVIALLASPSGAGEVSNSLTVTKTVVGSVPAGTTFTVVVDCVNTDTVKAAGFDPVTITFDEHGTPTSDNTIDNLPGIITCTATETVKGGATSTTYACSTSGDTEFATCPDGPTVPTVDFDETVNSSGTIVVTNTFPQATPPQTPPVVPAAEIVAAPALTG